MNRVELERRFPVLKELGDEKETVWVNPDQTDFEQGMRGAKLTMADIDDAEARLCRFAPFIAECFPETRGRGGLIESELIPVPRMQRLLNQKYGSQLIGRLLLKQDSHLAVAGSVKARGGIYEVLKHTEELALAHGLIQETDDYAKLASGKCRSFFEQYTIQVGSTGNLGMSIGIMSAAVGFQVIVHMSSDAKQWKKDLLRERGVKVEEYDADYSEAVKSGRALSNQNPNSYFVDDENSRNLFLGYAVAAKRLAGQLRELGIPVDAQHPLFVYLPCGVGGAPGGISFGLKQMFGDNVHCFFVEPVKAPCMLLGMATGLNQDISIRDIGLDGETHADGLAVGRPSGFVGGLMKPFLSGEFTVADYRLYDYLRDLVASEGIFLEPSACAAFQGPSQIAVSAQAGKYLKHHGLDGKMENATHIAWATGGSLVPQEIRKEYINTFLPE